MKGKIVVTLLALTLVLVTVIPTLIYADDGHLKTIAGILVNLNHFPSEAEKETLRDIVNDAASTDHVKTLATAMMNLKHYPTKADKTHLGNIMNDASANGDVREIAVILYNLSHKPTTSEKGKLMKMLE
jgi:hypothetical protein